MENGLFKTLKRYERILILVLMLMMAVMLGLTTIDLGWRIIEDIFNPPFLRLNVDQLLNLFGFVMLIIIGVELLETIMESYLTQNKPHVEPVISIAIVAIARKVIMMDIKTMNSTMLLGIAAIIIALSAGYYLLKKSDPRPPPS